MHEIGTHVIDIQILENTTIIYSNQLKITLCALGSASRLTLQSKTLPMVPLQHTTHLHWPEAEEGTLFQGGCMAGKL